MGQSIRKYFNPTNENSINVRLRRKRFLLFRKIVESLKIEGRPVKVLDIGGTQTFWERMNFTLENDVHITLLNLHLEKTKYSNFSSAIGDACDLCDYPDQEFDIVFSNSVIEHLFTKAHQKKMADEVLRVGKYYYIQTPNYFFPIEPHWLCPFFQYLPYRLRVFLTQNFRLGRHSKDKKKAEMLVQEVRLLSTREMKTLFYTGKCAKEKFFGLTKSITMYSCP